MSYTVEELKGKTLKSAKQDGNGDILLEIDTGDVYKLEYIPDCCASCSIVDIAGDLDDLVGTPLVMAEEVCSTENPPNRDIPEYQDSFTWTFTKFATTKGYVTITWYGESNGYYSETPSVTKNGRSWE